MITPLVSMAYESGHRIGPLDREEEGEKKEQEQEQEQERTPAHEITEYSEREAEAEAEAEREKCGCIGWLLLLFCLPCARRIYTHFFLFSFCFIRFPAAPLFLSFCVSLSLVGVNRRHKWVSVPAHVSKGRGQFDFERRPNGA